MLLSALLALSSFLASAAATSGANPAVRRHARVRHRVRPVAHAAVPHPGTAAVVTTTVHRRTRRRVVFNPWTEPTYADSTVGDSVDGEDLVVRRAAVDALGPYNGAVVIADPQTGRILSIVNQKLALKGAYQPCSTIKMVVSMASLSEGIVNAGSSVRITRRSAIDITKALAYSNNLFFAKLGEELGFERVEKYARLFGLGEKAGLDIAGEEAGYLTDEPPQTGVGMMTSFGDGIRITPLELTSIVSTLANGGTMYYLQYPRSEDDVQKFVPRIKRELDIANFLPAVKPGMIGAVEYGTARRANYDPNDPILGKTGTCTDTAQPGVHLGWFGSFNDVGNKKLAIVVLLTGGRGISGPIASGIGGAVYRNLAAQQYFGPQQQPIASSLVSLHD
ncbi:MAG: penicillin-binding protein [Acidobacteriaceae bacterium]|nr:penicillin-binding protein [Acidobacteriaceae bacterium]MBV9503137.1 penicillin-binding protein [Acidobacteriaceae bacterium]